MGACDFFNYGFGKTAADAFSTCVDRAQYEHGHGGYSGTIAEKGSFRVLPTPKTRIDLIELAECALGCDDDYTYTVWRERKEGDAPEWGCRTKYHDDGTTTTLVPEQKKIPAKLHDWVRTASRTANDKWGPAACVEITGKAAKAYRERAGLKGKQGKLFLFFGLASS